MRLPPTSPPPRADARHVVNVAGQTLETAVPPLLAVAGAAPGWWSLRTALVIVAVALLVH